jgi:hypothetical protein
MINYTTELSEQSAKKSLMNSLDKLQEKVNQLEQLTSSSTTLLMKLTNPLQDETINVDMEEYQLHQNDMKQLLTNY